MTFNWIFVKMSTLNCDVNNIPCTHAHTHINEKCPWNPPLTRNISEICNRKLNELGKSHLASVRIVGNKCYNTRRATSVYDDDKVRNDVNLLSYYLKNRKAAAENKEPAVALESCRYFSQPIHTLKRTIKIFNHSIWFHSIN